MPRRAGSASRTMEAAGVIRGYGASVDRESVGLALCVLAEVNLMQHTENTVREFERAVAACPQIVSLLQHDRRRRLRASTGAGPRTSRTYEPVPPRHRASSLPGVTHIRSSVVLKEVKAEAACRLCGAARAARAPRSRPASRAPAPRREALSSRSRVRRIATRTRESAWPLKRQCSREAPLGCSTPDPEFDARFVGMHGAAQLDGGEGELVFDDAAAQG